MTAMSAVTTRSRDRGHGNLTGVGTLLWFALRRDRVRLPVWILGITTMVLASAVSFPSVYPDAEARLGALMTIDNPGTTALIGAVYGDGDYTYGIMVGHELLVLTAIAAALMSIFTLVRHTRADEETGRAELIRSSVVGRHAHATAAVAIVVLGNVGLALALAVGLGSVGIETVTWSGSLLFGAAVAATGLVFCGVAALTVQLTEHARTASSSAGLVLAAAYVLRAIGDVSSPSVSWSSPLGWAQAVEAYHVDDWAPLLLPVVAAALLLTLAAAVSRRRDVGAGVLGSRPGPATAGPLLGGPLGLAGRLNRGILLGWAIGMFAFGLMYGPVLSEAATFLDDLPIMAEFMPDLDADGAELFGATIIAVAAILCAAPALQVVLRVYAEERAGRAGPLLATPLSRVRWLAASLLLAVVAGAAILLVMGAGIGLGAGRSMDDLGWIANSIVAAVSYLPAVAVVVGLGATLVAWWPRAAGASWGLIVFAAIVVYFGGLLDLPQWLVEVSPFAHVPQQPAADFEAAPLAWLSLVAVVLGGLALAGIRRRDIHDS